MIKDISDCILSNFESILLPYCQQNSPDFTGNDVSTRRRLMIFSEWKINHMVWKCPPELVCVNNKVLQNQSFMSRDTLILCPSLVSKYSVFLILPKPCDFLLWLNVKYISNAHMFEHLIYKWWLKGLLTA